MTEPCLPFLVLGHPRSGSRSLAAALTDRGLLVGHERPERDGISYALWNDLAAGLSDFERPILVERPDFGPLLDRIGYVLPAGTAEGPVPMPRLNDSMGKFGLDKERRSSDEILAAVPVETARRLEPCFALYAGT